MTSLFRFWLVVAALLASLLVAACGGGDDDNGDGDDRDGPAATVPADDTDEDVDDNGDGNGDADDDADEDGSELGEELSSLAARFGGNEAKIEYDFSATGDGEAEDMAFTLYLKPPDAWRVDFSGAGEDATLISNEDASYICAEDQCMESPMGGAFPIPFLGFMTDPDGLTDLIGESIFGLDVERSEREIADEDAACFSVEGSLEGTTGSAEYCFREDGLLLLFTAGGSGLDGSGEFTLKATDVEDEVSDDDFEPPYPVTDLSDLLE